jgi:RHS repeat-associated protein
MEKDDEVKNVDGTSYTTEFRQYDPRVGRWLSLDPLMDLYPHQSGYCSFNNNPIYFADPTGLEGEDPVEGDPIKTTDSERYSAFPSNPQNGDVVTLEITDAIEEGYKQKFQYAKQQDKWILKESISAKTNVWEDATVQIDGQDWGIAARHSLLGESTVEVLDEVATDVGLGGSIVKIAADETIAETISKGSKPLKIISKFTKRVAVVVTAYDVGKNLNDVYNGYQEEDTEKMVKGGLKATTSVGSLLLSAAAYGVAGAGLPGAVAAVAVTAIFIGIEALIDWW